MKTNSNVIGVIPARFASTRLPQKLLRFIAGKTLLQWTWEKAKSARLLDELIIACDHSEIEEAAKSFGARAVHTSVKHLSGTDRIAEAVRDIDAKIIINIQADEPLMHPAVIDMLVQELLSEPQVVMATAKVKIKNRDDIDNPNVVKVVCDKDDNALYFSRYPIPYFRQHTSEDTYYKHLGIYAYTKDFLFTFKNLPASSLEKAEKLEQLRALEAGYKIKVLGTQFDSCGVDTQEDLEKVERILQKK
ncbi:MAG: 3-deoxy-manno-octulosonate cytidylyltransferase [Candidatus Omnitrophica bacterium]|nr:3-deoxy-manno-octulosonate cytidylyltransferase [Candidatus Omnitrophota bacterium]